MKAKQGFNFYVLQILFMFSVKLSDSDFKRTLTQDGEEVGATTMIAATCELLTSTWRYRTLKSHLLV